MSDKKIIFSGVQPSGNLHIGNYIGAISQWAKLQNPKSEIRNPKQSQNSNELIFCIVDLHAITVPQDPKVLREKILEVAALYVASGIDSQKAHIFVQSENPDHTYLSWVFDCILPFGSLARMTQFKDKSMKQQEGTTVGLFNYPALMAADILLYDTDEVPVGEDQKQHVELTRDVAERFNRIYGEVFKLPEPVIQKNTGRIMSLSNPMAKMSKSDKDPVGTINLLDGRDEILEKIKRAVTDSGSEIVKREDKPAISNLLTIYSIVANTEVENLEEKYKSASYSVFKQDLAEAVVNFLEPIQKKYREIRENPEYLNRVLDEGRDFSTSKSSKKIEKVRDVMGLGR
ncbi:MAG: tryptophan--tRNA ligase [Armatimonadetes bacterium]|nr:MAG: tryptophan--tRNA ligase [Armatimonadota bacterium]